MSLPSEDFTDPASNQPSSISKHLLGVIEAYFKYATYPKGKAAMLNYLLSDARTLVSRIEYEIRRVDV